MTRPLEEQIAHYAVQTFANYGAETAEAALVGVVMAKLAPLRAHLEGHRPNHRQDGPDGEPVCMCGLWLDDCPAARLRAECGWGEGE
jgi:hypothetical protein